MVKNSRNFKKLLCLFLIMCLAASMLLTASFATSEGSDTPTLSPLQKVIESVLLLDQTQRKNFVDNVLDTEKDLTTRKGVAYGLLPILLKEDVDTALTEYDKFTGNQRVLFCTFINKGIPDNFDTTGIENIAGKINELVNNKKPDPNNFGLRLTLALLDATSQLLAAFDGDYDKKGKYVVFDDETNVDKIRFEYTGPYTGTFTTIIKSIGTLQEKGIADFDSLLDRAESVINKNASSSEITNFKLYLNTFNPKNSYIYGGTITHAPTSTSTPTTTPTNTPEVTPTSTSTSTPTPTPTRTSGGSGNVTTYTATATPTSTSTAIPTPTTLPTPTAEIKSSDKQITSFSFKGIKPEANGAIFEKTHTIIVKVPMETDLKGLVPTIEYKGASIKPESGEKKNFTNPVFYTVTAKDKSKARYVVIVVRAKNSEVIDPNEYPSVPGRDIFGHWAEDHLIGLIENGIITGYPDGSIKPDTHMTRAEVVTLIVKALGLSPAKDAKFNFKDSKDIPSWAQGYFKTALEKGFVKGYPNNTLKPMEKVTRAEFTVMVINAFGFDISKNADVKFNDAKGSIPDWAKQHISSAVNLKIISGYGDNTFKPNNFITRAEVGAIVDRCFGASGKSYPEL